MTKEKLKSMQNDLVKLAEFLSVLPPDNMVFSTLGIPDEIVLRSLQSLRDIEILLKKATTNYRFIKNYKPKYVQYDGPSRRS